MIEDHSRSFAILPEDDGGDQPGLTCPDTAALHDMAPLQIGTGDVYFLVGVAIHFNFPFGPGGALQRTVGAFI